MRWAALISAVVALPACVSEGPPPRRPPRAPQAQPAGLNADRMILSVGQFPEDTDRNGYYDTILVTVYLFSNTHAAPVELPGSFTFRLTGPDGEPLADWSFNHEQTAAARRGFLPGPGYLFRLSLLDVGTDTLTATEGSLRCRFEPVQGVPIEPRAGTTIVVGRAR